MIKVNIVSGFLGAGKTTLIKKILNEKTAFGKVMLLENEFGEVSVDGALLKGDIEVKEINNGCICCSLEGDLNNALDEIKKYDIDTLILEPSGVAKLSEIEKVFNEHPNFIVQSKITMVDAGKARIYNNNFSDFYQDQINNADIVILSRVDIVEGYKVEEALDIIESINPQCIVVTTPLHYISDAIVADLMINHKNMHHQCSCHSHEEEHHCGCHSHEDEHNCSCHETESDHQCHCHDEGSDHHCGCHSHEDEHHCGCHSHEDEHHCGCHSHEDEHHCGCHSHEEEHHCGCHEEEHHCSCHETESDHQCHCHDEGSNHQCGCTKQSAKHSAHQTFNSVGFKTIKKYSKEELKNILENIGDNVVRAKGIVDSYDSWLHFEYTIDEINITDCEPNYTGIVSVIGVNVTKEKIKGAFGLND